MPESELEVLLEAFLGSAAVSSKGSGCFEGGFCLGKGTGTMSEPGPSSDGVSGAVPFLGTGRGVAEEGVGVVGLSPSKLARHGSFSGDLGGDGKSGLIMQKYLFSVFVP